MTVEEAKAHGMQYSQTFKKGYGLWKDNFNAMALKTVLKMLLKKFAPKSIESVAQAIEKDQASFVGDIDNAQAVYVDNAKNAEASIQEAEYEEVNENVDVETGEVTEEAKVEQPKVDDEF